MLSPSLRSAAQDQARDYTDPEQEEQHKAAAALRDDQRRAIERALMGSAPGREWVWSVLADCHVWEKRLSATAAAYEQGFWDGEREAALRLMRHLAQSAPNEFGLMIKENDRG